MAYNASINFIAGVIEELFIYACCSFIYRISSAFSPEMYKAHVYELPKASRRWLTIFAVTKSLELHEQVCIQKSNNIN